MIFSLQRRFLLLLLLPVAAILIGVGVAGFIYARSFLFQQWLETTDVKLERAALEIRSRLNDKLDLIDLIGVAESIPAGNITQAFLIQQLAQKKGVKFVDLAVIDVPNMDSMDRGAMREQLGEAVGKGLYTMEICEDYGFCAPTTDPNALDRSLRIVKLIRGGNENTVKRLVVRIGFDSFMEQVRKMGLWPGSTGYLVTSRGQILASTDKSQSSRRTLGDTGLEIERKTAEAIRKKGFGTVVGEGSPPDMVAKFRRIPLINWYLVLITDGEEIFSAIMRFRKYYGIAGLAAFIVIVILIRFTTIPVSKAISEIGQAAARVEEGDYTVRVPEDRTDEIGRLNVSFNRMIEGLRQRDLIQRTFGRYVDRNIAEELMNRPEALRMGGQKKVVTIMMADLRNFTSVSEKLEPEEVIRFLNLYFSRMIWVIERFKGIIVDFYGDSILVFFDGVEADVKKRAHDAVCCALEMQQEQEGFLEEARAEGLPALRMGIGVHTGEVVVGNIGTDYRAKYGIVGSDVNLTARIQSTASGDKVVISEETYALTSDEVRVSTDFDVCLKGVEKSRQLYEVEALCGRDVTAEAAESHQ